MKKLILLYLLTSSMIVLAQDNIGSTSSPVLNNNKNVGVAGNDGFWVTNSTAENAVEGTTYLFSNWEGLYEIYVSENKGYRVVNLNYNLKSKTLESKISKDSVFQYDINKISHIKNNSKKYKMYNINGQDQFCHEIYASDKTFFLNSFSTELIKGTKHPITQEYVTKDRNIVKNHYFIKIGSDNYVEFSLKKKQILKLMGDKADKVEKFAADSKLSFTSEAELSKILNYFDSL